MSPQKPGDDSTRPTEVGHSPNSDGKSGRAQGQRPESAPGQGPMDKAEPNSATAVKRKAPTDHKWVGSQVRRMYDGVLNEPVPKNFTDLLKQAYDGKKTPEKS